MYFLAIKMGKSTYSNSVILEDPKGGQYHTVHRKQLPSLTSVQSDMFP